MAKARPTKQAVGAQRSSVKTISLKAALKGGGNLLTDKTKEASANANKEEEIIVDPSWNNPVEQDRVKLAWMGYARKIQTKNPRLASILNNHIPELRSGTILHVKLKNKTQDNELLEQKNIIFPYLKRELQNASLELSTELVIDKLNTTKAFTAQEKAKLMAKKNPALLLLTQKFDLDVE